MMAKSPKTVENSNSPQAKLAHSLCNKPSAKATIAMMPWKRWNLSKLKYFSMNLGLAAVISSDNSQV